MAATIKVVNMYTKITNGVAVNTTSKASSDWQRDLSPFYLGPCDLYAGKVATNVENAWQYSKLYAVHASPTGDPTPNYWVWANAGWANPQPVRYPMGRGAKPLHSFWDGQKYGYIDARKKIYAPLYAEAVQKTPGWGKLKNLLDTESLIVLRDYDGYDYTAQGLTLSQVLNRPQKKMGHAFVLAMLLLSDPALLELDLR